MKKQNFYAEKRLIFRDGPEGGEFSEKIKAKVAAARTEVAKTELDARGKAAGDKLAALESRTLDALAARTGTRLQKVDGRLSAFMKGDKHLFSVFKNNDGTYMFVKVSAKGEKALFDTKSQSLTSLISQHLDRVFMDEYRDRQAAEQLASSLGLSCKVGRTSDLGAQFADSEIVDYSFGKDGVTGFHITCDPDNGYFLVKHLEEGGEKLVAKANTLNQLVKANFDNIRVLAKG